MFKNNPAVTCFKTHVFKKIQKDAHSGVFLSNPFCFNF